MQPCIKRCRKAVTAAGAAAETAKAAAATATGSTPLDRSTSAKGSCSNPNPVKLARTAALPTREFLAPAMRIPSRTDQLPRGSRALTASSTAAPQPATESPSDNGGGKKFDISSFASGGGAKSGTSRITAMPLAKDKRLPWFASLSCHCHFSFQICLIVVPITLALQRSPPISYTQRHATLPRPAADPC